MMDEYEARQKAAAKATALKWVKLIGGGIIGLVTLVLFLHSFTTVEPGHRGVRVALGTVEDKSLAPGWYFMNPFTTSIHEMNVQTSKWDSYTQAYTKDVQTATVHFVLNYNLKPDAAHIVYQSVGENWAATLIAQIVTSQIKRVIGQYEAVELIAKRQDAQHTIETDIIDTLASKNVVVTGFQLTNIDYTPVFEKAVEAKVVAQQDAIREQNHTVQVEQQAKQTVISAQAEAESMRIRAQALESNRSLVAWEAVQKWNGVLPTYMLGGNSVPFIQMPQSEGK